MTRCKTGRGRARDILLSLLAVTALALSALHATARGSDGDALIGDAIDTESPAFVHRWLKPGQYLPLSEVKPGMTGYGLSVFQGTKVERFDVKVIGVVKKILNGRDGILVRLSGAPLGSANVIKGMSGSPVYIDGKLVGAISFGYDFSKEPIAGITPIVDMLDALAPSPEPRRIAAGHRPWYHRERSEGSRTEAASASPRLVPLVSPVALAGFSPRAEDFLSERLSRFGMSVTSGAAGGTDPSLAPGAAHTVQPGGAVGVMLTTGDFVTVATGTATANFAGKVLAFGHPFLQAGSVEFPMTTAYIHQVLPSLFVSFKVASPLAVVGSVTSDRPWSIGGQMGKSAHLIPATYTVTDRTRKIRRTYRCHVVDHPDLTPELLASTAISAIDATHQSSGPYVAHVASRIEAEGLEPITRTDRFSTNFTAHSLPDSSGRFRFVADPVGSFLLRTAAQITNNPFQKASIKRVELEVTLEDGHKTAEIEKVYVDRPFAAPGETVKVSCLLRPYNKEPVVEMLSFEIPRDQPDGSMLIGVSSGDEMYSVRKRMGLVDPAPESLKQVAEKILDRPRGDAVTLVAALPQQSLMVKGTKLTNPPAHWIKVFFSNRHTSGPSLVKGEIRVQKATDWLLDGSHILTVEVRSPEKVAARAAPYMVKAPAAGDDKIKTTEEARKAIDASRKTQTKPQSGAAGGGQQAQQGQQSQQQGDGGQTVKPESKPPPASPASPVEEYPHMRPALVWKQDTEEDFRSGKTEGTTVDSWGRMGPGFQEDASTYLPSVMQIWSGVWTQGRFYFGTTDELWQWSGQGAPEKVASFDSVALPAMAADAAGTVYVAAVPGGRVWAVRPGQKPSLVYEAREPIITSLCLDDEGNLYIGTAGSGRIYRRDPGGKVSQFFDSRQAHVLSLFFSRKDGHLYAGTGESGSVYRLSKEGKAQAVYQSSDRLVTGAVRDGEGNLYVATAGQGHLAKVLANGEEKVLASSEAFFTLHYDEASDTVFAGDAEGDITQACIDPVSGQPFFIPVCHTEQEAVLALASDGKERLYAGTSNLGMLRSFSMQPSSQASYQSAVRDAGRLARWSHLRAYGAFNNPDAEIARKVKFETRSGETALPDETWSAWQECQAAGDGFAIVSPPARYLQYRLSWQSAGTPGGGSGAPGGDAAGKKATTEAPPRIGRVEISYLPRDGSPRFTSISLKAGTAVSGKEDIKLSGSDPDGDNLLLSVQISGDGARTWKLVESDIRAKKPDRAGDKAAAKDKDRDKEKDEGKGTDKEKAKDQTEKKAGEEEAGAAKEGENGSADAEKKERPPGDQGEPEDKPGEEEPERPAPTGAAAGSEDGQTARRRSKKEKAEEKKPGGEGDKGKGGEEGGKSGERPGAKPKPGQKPAAGARPAASRPMSLKSALAALRSAATDSQSQAENFTWSWDTKKHKDGSYILKFILDDRLSNPVDSLSTIALRVATVDNKPPEIRLIESSRDADGRLQFKVGVKDRLTPVANAIYRLDEGEPFALAPLSGTPDVLEGEFGASGIKASSGSHKLEVKVTDAAGNTATKTFTVK